ncbi:MAG TPA: beta-propeller fold lactonase family protein [Bryobacteraceae bacterium]|nr:beta-propeller fold lactonase family protein [Bryobacteraceae bacterium]
MKKSHHRQTQTAIKRLFPKTWAAKNWAAIGISGFLALGVNQLHAGSGPSDTIYLESNSTAGNVIFTYTFDFTSAPTLKSMTPAGGIGVFDPSFALGPFDSDQNLIENSSGSMLFAVNSGSNSIAVFRIQSDGNLSPVPGSPFPSGGSDPVSVGLKGEPLVVVNKDQDPAQAGTTAGAVQPNYTTFNVTPDGRLVPVPDSTVSVAYGSSPSQALVAAQGNTVFGADFLGGLLQSFSLDPSGALDQNLPQTLPESVFNGLTGGHLPLGMRTHPSLPILYVDITPVSKVAVYTYNPKGHLKFVRAVPDAGAAPCWVVVNHAGTYLYVTNTGDDSVEVYSLADPLNPIEVQHFTMDSTNGGAVFSTVIDHTDKWLYVSSEQSSAAAAVSANAFHALKVAADGTLSEPFAPTNLPVTSTPAVRVQGITVF